MCTHILKVFSFSFCLYLGCNMWWPAWQIFNTHSLWGKTLMVSSVRIELGHRIISSYQSWLISWGKGWTLGECYQVMWWAGKAASWKLQQTWEAIPNLDKGLTKAKGEAGVSTHYLPRALWEQRGVQSQLAPGNMHSCKPNGIIFSSLSSLPLLVPMYKWY